MKDYLMRTAERITRIRARNSNTQMDLLKLYGIFCVVYAHCYWHGFYISGFGVISSIYVIQLFIFCAGYFYPRAMDGKAAYLKKCVRSYLLPFFCWNLVYGLLHDLLYALGLLRFGNHLSLYTLFIQPWLDNEQFWLNLPSWFLLTLFLTATLHWLIRYGLQKLGRLTCTAEIITLALSIGVSLLLIWRLGSNQHHGVASTVCRPLILLPYFQFGTLFRAHEHRISRKMQALLCLLLALVLLGIGQFQPLTSTTLYCSFSGNPLLLVISAIASVMLVVLLCGFLSPVFSRWRLTAYAGRCTMYIMLHHMLILYGIHVALFLLHRIWPLPDFAPAQLRSSIWYRYISGGPWLLPIYLILALSVPLLVHWLYETVVLKLSAKINTH